MNRRLVVLPLLLAGLARADAPPREFYELSAPLLPVHVGASMSQIEGDDYPTTEDAKIDALLAGSFSFEELVVQCAPEYPGITVPGGTTPLTSEQIGRNFFWVGKCAYEKYSSKPYWIPQLVDDLDVCTWKLGLGWRMPTEADVESLSDSDLQFIADQLATVPEVDGWSWARSHFDTEIFVRGANGRLRVASLRPGTSPRTHDIDWYNAATNTPQSGSSPLFHYEGGVGVRCVRRTIIQAQ